MRRFVNGSLLLWSVIGTLVALVIGVGLSMGLVPPWQRILTFGALAGVVLNAALAACIALDSWDPWPDLDATEAGADSPVYFHLGP